MNTTPETSSEKPAQDHRGVHGNLRGIVAMTAGTAGFVTNDMLVKLASATLPTGQIMFVRGLMTTAVLLAVAFATGALRSWVHVVRPAVVLRTVAEIGGTVLYLTALFHMPIANASAILQAIPLVLTLVAAAFLGERVGWRRWLAVGAGLAGLLMIVQPGAEGFNVYALIAVGALICTVLRDVWTRDIPIVVPGILIAVVTACSVTVSGAAWGIAEDWSLPAGREWMLLAAAATSLAAGYFFLIEGVRYGEISAVAPFRYTYVILAIVYGIVIWREMPNALALCGIALIVGSGIVVYYRESRLLRRAALIIPDNP